MERIGAAMEQRWGLEGENKKEENRDDKGESKDGSRESQKERTLVVTTTYHKGQMISLTSKPQIRSIM